MFKLIKIQNSGVNVPEPMILGKSAGIEIKIGEALILEEGLLYPCTATTKPTHVAIRNANYDEDLAVVYEVNPNMLFETTVDDDPADLKVGEKVTISTDEDGCAVNVSSSTASGVATIVDLMGATDIGDKVTVKF